MLVKMKKWTLYALKQDRDALLMALQKDGSVMIESEGEKKGLEGAEEVSAQLEKTGQVLRFMARNGAKGGLFPKRTELSYDAFLTPSQTGEKVTERVDTLANRVASLDSEAAALRTQIESLNPWLDLDIPLEQLSFTEDTRLFVGFVPDKEVDAVREGLEPLLAEMKTYGLAPDGQALVVLAHKDAEEGVKHLLKDHEFTEAVLPKRSGLARCVAKELAEEAKGREIEAEKLRFEAKGAAKDKASVELYYDQLSAEKDRLADAGIETERAFVLTGWIRGDRQSHVEQVISGVTDAYQLTFRNPNEGEIPPTVLENNKLVAPYESVIGLYSLPKAGTLDPDFLMAPFHFIFFGMMLSDAGYGLVLTILLYLVMKKVKPQGLGGQLVMVCLFGSISTIIWGALFGGWFGLEWHPLLFVPMNEPLKMLALCFGLGILHLALGMLTKAYLLIRDGDIMGAVCDQFSWLILFTGLFLMPFVPGSIGKDIALLGAAIIVLFGGRDKKGIVSRLIGGVLSLYNISGYLSDLLSYSRIFALGLATGVIAMVINTVAQMLIAAGPVGTAAAVVVLVGGHFFNIIINILGAFVHSSRLQYIEFFGKFYEAGGRAFVPLALRTKYTDIVK